MKKTAGLKWFAGLVTVSAFVLIVNTSQAQEGEAAEPQESETAQALETAGLTVETAVICESVADRQPVNEGTSFSSGIGKLYCFTKIVGADTPVQVSHVWYYGDEERARVDLNVKGSNWRTYSSKIIQSHEIGAWKVDILGPDGTMLQTVSFEITE